DALSVELRALDVRTVYGTARPAALHVRRARGYRTATAVGLDPAAFGTSWQLSLEAAGPAEEGVPHHLAIRGSFLSRGGRGRGALRAVTMSTSARRCRGCARMTSHADELPGRWATPPPDHDGGRDTGEGWNHWLGVVPPHPKGASMTSAD